MEKTRVDQVVSALKSKGVDKGCPRCGRFEFSLVGETFLPIQNEPNTVVIGGPSVPSVIIACENCGYVTLHASRPLGLATGDQQK
jgi:predicted nucleic-acid-binding Zn-ribbon protein